MQRSEVEPGKRFYADRDIRSQCIAVRDNEATDVIRQAVGRPDIMFHILLETGELSYLKPTAEVYATCV